MLSNSDNRPGKIHLTAVSSQEWYAQEVTFIYLAHHKDLFQLHISNPYRYLHYSIERKFSAICSLESIPYVGPGCVLVSS